MILLVWLWLTNVVLLFGAELNAVDRPAPLARAPARLRRPAAAGEGARRTTDGRSVIASGHEHSARAAGAVAAQLAVRRVGDGLALVEHAAGEAEQPLAQRRRVGGA